MMIERTGMNIVMFLIYCETVALRAPSYAWRWHTCNGNNDGQMRVMNDDIMVKQSSIKVRYRTMQLVLQLFGKNLRSHISINLKSLLTLFWPRTL